MTDIVFGIHAIKAILAKQPTLIDRINVLHAASNKRLQEIITLAKQNNIPCQTSSREEFNKMLDSSSRHQGVIAHCHSQPLGSESELIQYIKDLDTPPLLLILDSIQDPHNFGACLRVADAAGVDAVIYPKDRAAQLNATVRHVASGAASSLRLFQITNLARVIKDLQNAGVWIYGTEMDAEESIYSTDLSGPCALVMGAEGSGMRQLTKTSCDFLMHIPMQGLVNSLNVSVATGVCLFEAVRQRSSIKPIK